MPYAFRIYVINKAKNFYSFLLLQIRPGFNQALTRCKQILASILKVHPQFLLSESVDTTLICLNLLIYTPNCFHLQIYKQWVKHRDGLRNQSISQVKNVVV